MKIRGIYENKVSDFLSDQWYFSQAVKTGSYKKIPAGSRADIILPGKTPCQVTKTLLK